MDYLPGIIKAYFIVTSVAIYAKYHNEIHDGFELFKNKCTDTLFKYVHKASLKFIKTRSDYIWINRNHFNNSLKKIIDKILIVNPEIASVNASSKSSDRIIIEHAIASRGDTSKDVTVEMRSILVDFDDPFMGDNGQITIDLVDIVPNMATDTGEDNSWYIEITYRGHSDPSKRIEARTYSVKYKANWKDIITFPPYSINDKPVRGLGCTKVLSALSSNGGDVTQISKQYAGMKVNFYSDCSDEVLKNHMNVDATVRASKGETFVVSKKS